MKTFLTSIACVSTLVATSPSYAQAPEPISIVVFGAPSLGALLPPVIKAQKLDEKNGLAIKFEERTPDAYTAQFNSGEFQVGGSAALLTVGLADARGVKVTYLFNLFDFWGAVVTSRPDVKELKDLEGKDLAAAKGTTNYVMFDWFARQLGADTGKFSVINTATPGLIGYAMADRASAIQLWEPAYTTLMSKKPEIRTIDIKIADSWKKFTGSSNIPYLGVAAHVAWAEKNKNSIPKLFAAYKEAAEWVAAHPEEAAKLILPKGTPDDQKAIAALIRHNDRLGMNVSGRPTFARKSTRSMRPASRSPSCPRIRRRRRSIEAREMTDMAQQTASPPTTSSVMRAIASKVWTSVLPFIVVIALWQFASLFFPRFLFPSLIDVFWRCIDIFSSGAMFADVLATVLRILAGLAGAFVIGGVLALDHGALEGGRQVPVADPDVVSGHSRAVLGGVRHHLVSRRRISHLLHHGDDDAARLHVPGARRAARHVEGSDGDGVRFRPTRAEAVSRDDRAGDPSGHPDGVEGQSRQRLARGRGGRTGRRHRRRRLSAAAAAATVRHGRRAGLDAAAGVLRADRARRAHTDRKHAPSAIGPSRSVRYDRYSVAKAAATAASFTSTTSRRCSARKGRAGSYRAVDISISMFAPGQMLALLGKTGCGKSTIFNMIAGLTEPTAGTVRVNGKNPFADFDAFRGKMAIVFQSDRLLPWRTAIQNVEARSGDAG